MTLTSFEAADRFLANEERLNTFLNEEGTYTTSDSETVETIPSLVQAIKAEMLSKSYKGVWATATAYVPNNLVNESNVIYICLVAHTSGTFATDLSSDYWQIYQDTSLRDDLLLTDAANGAALVAYTQDAGYPTGSAGDALNDRVTKDAYLIKSLKSGSTAGSSGIYTVAIAGITALAVGLEIRVKFNDAFYGSATLNLNSLGAVSLSRFQSYPSYAETSSVYIASGIYYDLVYTGSSKWLIKNAISPFATMIEAIAGTEAYKALSPSTLRYSLNASGSAPVYACRAWANYNGSSSTLNASGNIASVTKLGTGNYRFNFTTALPNAFYSVGHSIQSVNFGPTMGIVEQTTTYVIVQCTRWVNADVNSTFDPTILNISIVA